MNTEPLSFRLFAWLFGFGNILGLAAIVLSFIETTLLLLRSPVALRGGQLLSIASFAFPGQLDAGEEGVVRATESACYLTRGKDEILFRGGVRLLGFDYVLMARSKLNGRVAITRIAAPLSVCFIVLAAATLWISICVAILLNDGPIAALAPAVSGIPFALLLIRYLRRQVRMTEELLSEIAAHLEKHGLLTAHVDPFDNGIREPVVARDGIGLP